MTNDRILARAYVAKDAELTTARIPVRFVLEKDKTERTMRRYAADWLRLRTKDTSVETRFESFPMGMTWTEGEEEIPILAAIIISWWPRPPQPEKPELPANRSRT